MESQRLKEWTTLSESDLSYHIKQWDITYRSTEAFAKFVSGRLSSGTVADVGCGAGGATYALAKKFPSTQFVGLDISAELIARAKLESAKRNIKNLSFEVADCYNLKPRKLDGVVSLQTLSWLPDWREPLQQIEQSLQPEWIAISSLFYQGDISCRIEVTEHQRQRVCFYNVYSVPSIARWAESHYYRLTQFEEFEIDLDLQSPSKADTMGTRTLKVLDPEIGSSKRLQISGPLLMNWGFLMLARAS